MKTKFICFTLIAAAFLNLNAQTNLKLEEIVGNKLSFTFTNDIPFNLIKEDNKSTIRFYGFVDESKTGEFILPSKDVFINIPKNSSPNVRLIPLKTRSINALPELNPVVERINDSTKIYTNAKELVIGDERHQIEVKGNLWIGDQYCIHLKVHPFYYDFEKRAVIKIEEYKIEMDFNTILNPIEITAPTKNPIIANTKYFFPTSGMKLPINKINSDDWIDYSKTYLKIGTDEDAIYRISKQDLLISNVPINSVNPKSLKMYWKGIEIPIFVFGEQDNQFDDTDYIEFVGRKNYGDENYREAADFDEPYTEYINRYSDTTVYWLTWDGNDGLRTNTILQFTGSSSDTLDYYDELIHVEQNPWYDFSLGGSSVRREYPFIHENETWNWWGQNVGTKSNSFTISDLYPDKPAKAYVKLQSWSTNIAANAHLLHLKINTEPTAYDSGYIDKYVVKILHASFNSSSLKIGSNSLKIISEPTLADPNRCFGDWWEIEYPRFIKLKDDSLLFAYRSLTNPLITNVKLTNVQSGNLSLYKFFENYQNIKITNYDRVGDALTFADTVKPGQKYIIMSDSKIKSPFIYSTKQFVNLRNSSNQADYVLLTHPVFINEAQNYLSFIETNYNVNAKLINVVDIYDEFNFGFFAPEPIKDFLIVTSSLWQNPAPKNVFIVGRSNYDYHGYKTIYANPPAPFEPNFVPSYGVPVSDNWYVIWDSTGAAIPQMNIGRLPARNVEEFQHYFTKHQNYLSNSFNDWNKKYILFTGGNFTNPAQIDRLKAVNDFVADNYIAPSPIGGISTHFYKTASPVTNFGPYEPEEIQETLDAGGLFISYLGHSGTQTWDNSITDPSQLNNNVNRNPMISDFGCSTAKFAEPDITSFSELFVNGLNGQAISYVGNTSLGYESTALAYPRYFYGKILKDSVYNIGDAHRLSKIQMLNEISSSGTYEVFSYTNTLVGDPIVSLPIPAKPNFVIKSDGVNFIPAIPTDLEDSLIINIKYANLGSVILDSLEIKVEDLYQGTVSSSRKFKKPIPLNFDQFSLSVPIKDLPGEHTLKIHLDAPNSIDEIDETDNYLELNYNVLTGAIRTKNIYENSNWINNEITFLNPSADPSVNYFEMELSLNSNFQNSIIETVPFDTFYTNINLSEEYRNKKFWMRAKLPNSTKVSITQTFFSENEKGFFVNDSAGFSEFENTNLSFRNNAVSIDTTEIYFNIISAGNNDGRTAVISKNGPNLIPENTLGGHHVCIFKDTTYEFINYKRFDLRSGNSAIISDYISFLDTLDERYLYLVAIADDGRVTSVELKDKIKEFGSQYIDSLEFRGSWAFIGKRNAVQGSMPEIYSNPFEGRVTIDTTILQPQIFGTLLTSEIGPASIWESIRIDSEIFEDSQIKIRPIGIKATDEQDTLDYFTFTNNSASLTNIQSSVYPRIKLLIEFEASSSGLSPVLKSIFIAHKSLPEIGTNYQTVQLSADSVEQGEDIGLSFYVYNIGDVAADSIKVLVELIDAELTRQTVYEKLIPTLNPFERNLVSFNYNTVNTKGEKQFSINLDPENNIKELFEDNNFYSIPFVIKGDSTTPNLQISFDGKEILDGEYISSNPLIRIELGDPSLIPIVDTSSVLIQLNNKQIYFSDAANNINYTFSSTNPKMIVEYQPILEKGEYFLNIFAKDASGNLVSPAGITKVFYVEAETKILDIFNYPNPFTDETYFTFKLTQIPDELKIKVYTIAGRLVKDMQISQSDLNFDFNKIYWDGKDQDGDRLANGVYFYKVIMFDGDKTEESIHKMAVLK